MQTPQIREFTNKVALLLPDTTVRRVLLPTILGMAVGNFLQVKQGLELNPMTAFNDLHIANVSRAVSVLNEEILMDVPTAIESAKTMYMVRHRLVNSQPAVYSVNPDFDFMAIALGLSTIVTPEVYQLLKDNALSSTKLYTMANLMLDSLKSSNLLAL